MRFRSRGFLLVPLFCISCIPDLTLLDKPDVEVPPDFDASPVQVPDANVIDVPIMVVRDAEAIDITVPDAEVPDAQPAPPDSATVVFLAALWPMPGSATPYCTDGTNRLTTCPSSLEQTAYGQDGNHRTNPPSYTVSADQATAYDNLTRLVGSPGTELEFAL